MIIDCISDLHGFYPKMPGGDFLIVAGDMNRTDNVEEWRDFFDWIKSCHYRKKVYIGGNHDNFLTHCLSVNDPENAWIIPLAELDDSYGVYLCDSGIEFEGLKIWGSPWTKSFEGMNPKCKAFTVDAEEELDEKFSLIPEDTDILITHSPPYGFFDKVSRETKWGTRREYTGSISLRRRVAERKEILLHVFGHIHEWGGNLIDTCRMKIINASHVNEFYKPVNSYVRVEL